MTSPLAVWGETFCRWMERTHMRMLRKLWLYFLVRCFGGTAWGYAAYLELGGDTNVDSGEF